MMFSRFQVAPPICPPSGVSVCGVPPVTSIFFRFPSAANTTNRLSGDHAGHTDCGAAFSVPGSRRAVGESSARIQTPSRPSGPAVAPLEQLFGESVYVHQFKLNAKAAFEGDVWQWHQDYGTWARDDGMPEPRAMNIAVFLDEVMPINGPLLLIPRQPQGRHVRGRPRQAHHVLSALDARQGHRDAALPRGRARRRARHRRADRQARLGADVPRQPGARLAAQHHALPAQDRLCDVLRLSNHITKFTRAEWIAHRDFTPIEPVGDDALLEYARAHRVAAE